MIKIISILLFTVITAAEPKWHTDFEEAKKEAAANNKLILITFSGSDWCSHCIRMKKTILDKPNFTEFAAKNLVLLNADFPRKSKNKLSDEQVKKNEKLSAVYNPTGALPLTVLIDANGKVLRQWTGVPKEGCVGFVESISQHVK